VAGPVRSPTYTLIEPYQVTGRVVYHLDLYRLAASRDLEMLALRDLLDSRAVLLVEWASRGGANLPVADVWIQMSYSNVVESASRKIELGGVSPAGKQLAASVQISADKARVSL